MLGPGGLSQSIDFKVSVGWRRLRDADIATGAFPIGLAAKRVEVWFADDLGVCDSEPFELVRVALCGPAGSGEGRGSALAARAQPTGGAQGGSYGHHDRSIRRGLAGRCGA